MNSEFLQLKQKYTITKVNAIMRYYPSEKYEIRFRNGKIKTAGTVLEDKKTHFKTFIFSNYWIQALLSHELDNLIKHECAHAISDMCGHGNRFIKICKKLKCSKKWQTSRTENINVYSSMLKKR